jgi:hypothetical protein
VAVAEPGIRGHVREYMRIANMAGALARWAGKLGRVGVRLRFSRARGRRISSPFCVNPI